MATATVDFGTMRILSVVEVTCLTDWPHRKFLCGGHRDGREVQADDRLPKYGQHGCREIRVYPAGERTWRVEADYDRGIS